PKRSSRSSSSGSGSNWASSSSSSCSSSIALTGSNSSTSVSTNSSRKICCSGCSSRGIVSSTPDPLQLELRLPHLSQQPQQQQQEQQQQQPSPLRSTPLLPTPSSPNSPRTSSTSSSSSSPRTSSSSSSTSSSSGTSSSSNTNSSSSTTTSSTTSSAASAPPTRSSSSSSSSSSSRMSGYASFVPRAALLAAAFLRPPGRFKRATLRESPQQLLGPGESLVKAAVRRREKARRFSLLPPARYLQQQQQQQQQQRRRQRRRRGCGEVAEAPLRSCSSQSSSAPKETASSSSSSSSSNSNSSSSSSSGSRGRGQVPVPLPPQRKTLEEVRGVPSVAAAALQHRLAFLLGPQAPLQQQQAKLREGLTPYQAELFMWQRQLTEIRRIYRAQYLQRLAEVTREERQRHQLLLQQTREDKRLRREEALDRLLEKTKRRAVLHERQQIERKVTQAVQLGRVSRKKTANLLWLNKLQAAAHYQQAEKEAYESQGPSGPHTTVQEQQRAAAAARKEALRSIDERNVSATQILQSLGFCGEPRVSPNKKITGTDDVFRELMEASFALLPEDGPSSMRTRGPHDAAEMDTPAAAAAADATRPKLTEKERAELQYSAFSNEEKLALIDQKLEQLTQQIEQQAEVRGAPTDLLLVQLRDHLEAAKQAYLEGQYLEETEQRMQQQQQQQQQGGAGKDPKE
ncbi:hypothetical protein, conserved, partial [Eimeria tenella]